MRRFSFVLHPLFRFPFEILIFIFVIGFLFGIYTKDIDAIVPSLAGVLIFFLFFVIKRFSFILVSDRTIKIQFGAFAFCDIALSNIKDISTIEHKAFDGIGVKIRGRGEIAMVTRAGKITELHLAEMNYCRMFGFARISFNVLRLSPEKQDEFIVMIKELVGIH